MFRYKKLLVLLVAFLSICLLLFTKNHERRFMIMPHHGLVEGYMKEYYEEVFKDKPELIVVIAPNHYESGLSCIQTDLEWKVDDINTDLYRNIILDEAFEALNIQFEGNNLFKEEHGLYEHVKVLRDIGYKGKYLPIMLAKCATEEELVSLGEILSRSLKGKNVAFVASIDFGHFDNIEITKNNDERTLRSISGWFGGEKISLEDWRQLAKSPSGDEAISIDSPETMFVWLKLIDNFGMRNKFTFELWKNTNSLEILGIEDPRLMTSHIFGKVVPVIE